MDANLINPDVRAATSVDLTFVQPGDRFATRAGFTATVKRINGFRVEGYIETDYLTHDAQWRQDGTANMMCDDVVDKLPRLPEQPKGFFARLFESEPRR